MRERREGERMRGDREFPMIVLCIFFFFSLLYACMMCVRGFLEFEIQIIWVCGWEKWVEEGIGIFGSTRVVKAHVERSGTVSSQTHEVRLGLNTSTGALDLFFR